VPSKLGESPPPKPRTLSVLGGFDFDFNIPTAFIRLGRARPVRGGVPSIVLFFDFISGLVTSIFN
jgi:hypothetical protein